jgi:hypothetical protein
MGLYGVELKQLKYEGCYAVLHYVRTGVLGKAIRIF